MEPKKRRLAKILTFTLLCAPPAIARAQAELPSYTRASAVSGKLTSVGSDTMKKLMLQWRDTFRSFYPDVSIDIEAKGSLTAPPALVAATAQLGPMSREMKHAEIDAFVDKYGYEPTAVKTSIDMLAVYVHKENPIKSLTLQQVDAIFSKTRNSGYPDDITTWGHLGLTGEWADKPIRLYGRNSASGTYAYLKEHVLENGLFKATVVEQPDSSSVVQNVSVDEYAIGYSGIGYKTADVRAVPLAPIPDSKPVPAEAQYAYDGEYPLARFLYLYFDGGRANGLDSLRREFLIFVLSSQGQNDVMKSGFLPLPATILAEQRKKVVVW